MKTILCIMLLLILVIPASAQLNKQYVPAHNATTAWDTVAFNSILSTSSIQAVVYVKNAGASAGDSIWVARDNNHGTGETLPLAKGESFKYEPSMWKTINFLGNGTVPVLLIVQY